MGNYFNRCPGELLWRGAIERCTLILDKIQTRENTYEGEEGVPSQVVFKDFTLVSSNLLLLF